MADSREALKGLFHRVRGAVTRQRSSEGSGLRIVKDSEDADIDIVAVHGLGAQGFKSWVTLEGGRSKPWLEELLARDIPHARIMTYAYASDGVNYRYLVRNVLYGRALDLVRELGNRRGRDGTSRRPLFFIAHSLGGWIVKRALIISSEAIDAQLKDVELSTCGVAFLGTLSVGRPLSPTPLAHVIRRTTSGLDEHPSGGAAARALDGQPQASDVEWLENQMEAFKAITANLPQLSFHETKQSVDGFVVEQRHSMPGSDGVQIGLSATHSGLVQFQGRDANYKTFVGKFREMICRAQDSGLLESKRMTFDLATDQQPEYLKQGFDIPYKLPGEPSVVIHRNSLLELLAASLEPPSDQRALHVSIAGVWGDAGAGKTTLARDYAELNKDELSFVFWIWAESWETVVTSYLGFANNLVEYYSGNTPRARVENDLGLAGVEEMLKVKSIQQLDALRVKSVVRAVRDWLMRPENDKWLLIFDNVKPSFDVSEFIPLTLAGKVILTSRDSSSCVWGTRLRIGPMVDDEAVELLRSAVGDDALDSDSEGKAAYRLVRRLKCHPQSIALAASTISKKGLDISQYQKELDSNMPLRLLGSTLDQSSVTRTVLRVSAMLCCTVIPVALFTPSNGPKNMPTRFADAFAEIKAFRDASRLDDVLQYLFDQNFIQTPSPDSPPSSATSSPSSPSASQDTNSSATSFETFILDPAAREHVRATLKDGEQQENAWLACNICVDGIREKEASSSSLAEIHDFGRIMAPHAKTCYDDWSGILQHDDGDGDGDIAWQVLGNVCMTQGALEQAIGCFELSLRQRSNADARERIQTSLSLASLLQQAGQHESSARVLTDIDSASIDKALGHRVALAKVSAAAARGDYDYAEDQYGILEHKQEEELGPADATTVGTVQKLASTLEQLGKMEEAQALYRRVYISYQSMFGQGHPITVEALDELAHASRASNAIDEAEALYKKSLEIKTRTLGADHPSTAHAMQKLAVLDDMRCRYEDAKTKYQKALDIMAASLGKAHPLYTTTMENMALSCRLRGHAISEGGEAASIFSSEADTAARARRSRARRRLTISSTTTTAAAAAAAATTTTTTTTTTRDSHANNKSREEAVLRDASRRRAFAEAEKLYLDVLAIKKSAIKLYREEEVVETASKLQEMYENEPFFDDCRDEKALALMGLLREVKRRGTL
ncbi:tetratricopeptide-like helical [Trichoderma cornu-damae]|uniref:Tetratricopeptide-like helical n=1 Tax=Trichoderma cornu-damae TaxID=654480 RepID=A0A9P8TTP5_9HYPO|nr:tetratricopeptide-like helical [Trichoderma cornu-damae]